MIESRNEISPDGERFISNAHEHWQEQGSGPSDWLFRVGNAEELAGLHWF